MCAATNKKKIFGQRIVDILCVWRNVYTIRYVQNRKQSCTWKNVLSHLCRDAICVYKVLLYDIEDRATKPGTLLHI